MNILVERARYRQDEYEIVAWDHIGYGVSLAWTVGEDGRLQSTRVDEGSVPPVLMVVNRDFLEALLRASGDVVPPSDATSAHLRDAVTVRDRLLVLVEEAVRNG